MNEPLRLVLSDPEIVALVAVARLSPSGASPLPIATEPPGSEAVASLREHGVLDASGRMHSRWAAPLATLAEPRARYSVRLLSPNNDLAGAVYYVGDTVVAWATENGRHMVTAPIDLRNLFTGAADWMQTATLPDSARFSGQLSTDEFTAFLACVDAYREERVLALVDRRPVGPDVFQPDVLLRQIESSSVGDGRWLSGIVARFGVRGVVLDRDSLARGVDQLQARGWVEWVDNGVEILPVFAPLCEDLGNTLPCLTSEAASPDWFDAVLAVRGRDAFWLFAESPDGQGVTLSAVNGAGLHDIIERHLQMIASRAGRSTPPRATATAPVGAPVTQTVTAPPRATRTAAPAIEPKATEPIPRLCASCGASLTPGKRFCVKCGTKVGP